MTITAEELRKVYEETFEGAIVAQESQGDAFDAALLAIYRLGFKDGAEKQRAVEPTEEMTEAGVYAQEPNQNNSGGSNNSNRLRRRSVRVYRAMSAVAPLVVPE